MQSFVITTGSMSFDSGGVTFRFGNQNQRFPISESTSGSGPLVTIPGFQVTGYQSRAVITNKHGSVKDESTLTLTGDDGVAMDIIAGQPLSIYRIDITFSDQRHLVLWKPASEIEPTVAPFFITITGGFRVSGRVVWKRGMTLRETIGSMGDVSDGFHDAKVTVIRNGVRIPMNLNSIIKSKVPDPLLLPGDRIQLSY